MKISQLSDLGGVSVEGVDLANPSAEENRTLGKLYDEHGLVVVRDQKLTKPQLVIAGTPFGGAMIDRPAGASDPEAKGVFVISTRGATGDVVPEDPEKLVGDLEWHSDQAYVAAPNRGKILYAVQVPEKGGKTGFIDGQATYTALSDAVKKRIANFHVIQSWNKGEHNIKENRAYRINGDQEMAYNRFPDTVYPMVYGHPITGAKVLNVPPLWSAGIVEMPGADGLALVEELKQHIVQAKFQYWHPYRVGDAVVWDNWRFIHASSGTPGRYVRTLWGIAIKGGPEIGRVLARAAA